VTSLSLRIPAASSSQMIPSRSQAIAKNPPLTACSEISVHRLVHLMSHFSSPRDYLTERLIMAHDRQTVKSCRISLLSRTIRTSSQC